MGDLCTQKIKNCPYQRSKRSDENTQQRMLPYDASKKITLRAKTIGKGQPSSSKKEQEVEKILLMEGNWLILLFQYRPNPWITDTPHLLWSIVKNFNLIHSFALYVTSSNLLCNLYNKSFKKQIYTLQIIGFSVCKQMK